METRFTHLHTFYDLHIFKKIILKNLDEYSNDTIQLSSLNFHAQLEMSGILYIIKKLQ